MDYRLVKQFSNNAADNFFNFFYKMVDFGMVVVDVFWAFLDIWYHFFMIFINLWLYLYYFFLYIIDRLSMTGLFAHKSSARGGFHGTAAYTPGAFVPHNPMYGKIELPSAPRIISAPKSSGKVKAAASAVASVASVVRPKRPSGAKGSFFRDIAGAVELFFFRIFRAIKKLFLRMTDLIVSKLKPVKEEPVQGKSLIDEYMKEYERKKK